MGDGADGVGEGLERLFPRLTLTFSDPGMEGETLGAVESVSCRVGTVLVPARKYAV